MEKTYNSEEEFLKDYDSSKFKKLSITTDILIFSIANEENSNYRKLSSKKFSILLVKRDTYPFKDKWCLPGGFVNYDEDLEDAAKRILKNETNLDNIYLEQVYTFGNPNRDPRMRIISTTYMSLIDKNRIKNNLNYNASWFNINILEDNKKVNIILDNNKEKIKFIVKKVKKDNTTNTYDYIVEYNDKLAFDHPIVIVYGINRLKNKLEYTDIVFNMMPKYFTLGELQQVYETILNKQLLAPAFRRIIKNKVEKTELVKMGEGHRPSIVYKYKEKK